MRRHSLLILMTVILAGCAMWANQPTGLTHEQEFLLSAQTTYIQQYNDYKYKVAQPNLTDAQKQALKTKKKVLVEVEPLLRLYSQTVYSGGVPPAGLEDQISALFTQIGGKI